MRASDHSHYWVWHGIKVRCFKKSNPDYWRYGGAGVTMHPEWRDNFQAFVEGTGPRPSKKHSLDRYPDKYGSYVPGNVRWATAKEQMNNRRPSNEWNKKCLT